tara:strand:- start:111 stop:587 length:477 start_codon:yes stop_codon:yes gene_type:complete
MSFLSNKFGRGERPNNTPWNQDMNRMFDTFFSENWPMPKISEESAKLYEWSPRVDVSETDKEFKVRAELPGVKEKDVEVSIRDNTLYIKGEKNFERDEEKEDYHHIERSYGSFQRSIPFSTRIDEERVSAKFEDGVLKVKLKKSEEALKKSRRIDIKS